jgi:mannose-1-phosphate guanylyltransferase
MMVCFGIRPTYPETGYGYIKIKEKFHSNSYAVDKFVEKPDLGTAMGFLKNGKYLWNSGIFMCKLSILSSLFRTSCEELWNNIGETLEQSSYTGNTLYLNDKCFPKCKDISFDYAIMEKLDGKQLVTVSMNLLWSDMGNYSSLFSMSRDRTEDNNVIQGRVIVNNTENCYLRSSGKIICCSDIENLVVVEENDVILVMRKNKSQNIKKLMEIIEERDTTLK